MRFKPLSLGLAAVLAVGCSDQTPAPTALDDAAGTPSFDFTNGPDQPGNSGVVRWQSNSYYYNYIDDTPDDETWVVFIGLPDPPTDLPTCGGSTEPGPFSIQGVWTKVRETRNVMLKGAPAHAWNRDDFLAIWQYTAQGLCNALSLPQLAWGTASVHVVSNDDGVWTTNMVQSRKVTGKLMDTGNKYDLHISKTVRVHNWQQETIQEQSWIR